MKEENLPRGYLEAKPTVEKLTVTNLTNFAESEGVYGTADSKIKQIGYSILITLIYIIVIWVLSAFTRQWWAFFVFLALTFPIPLRMISLIVFKEKQVMKDYQNRKGQSAEMDLKSYISFYDMQDSYPYIQYYIDGTIGITMKLVRRTTVGHAQVKAFQHAEILSAFYNEAAKRELTVTDIDTQALNTRDTRFDTLAKFRTTIKNEAIKDVLTYLHSFLRNNSEDSTLTYEYFVITTDVSNEDDFYSDILDLMRILKGKGYKSIKLLSPDEVSSLIRSLFGLAEFPIYSIMQEVAMDTAPSPLKLLWVGNAKGQRKTINASRSDIAKRFAEQSKPEEVKPEVQSRVKDEYKGKLVDLFGDESSNGAEGMTSVVVDLDDELNEISSDKVEKHKVDDVLDFFDD